MSNDVICPAAPGVYDVTGDWFVVGGVGRFSSATGRGTLEGSIDLGQGVFDFQLTGGISQPNG